MKFFKKTTICQAIAVSMMAGVLLGSNQAFAYGNDDNANNTTDTTPYINKNGMGQALIYPYYTVNGGFKTSFNVFNTSDTHAVAVKVRFREYQNSRDVLDFNLILSPNDKWSGSVLPTAGQVHPDAATALLGGARLTTSDTSCTIPFIPRGAGGGVSFNTIGYMLDEQDLDFKDSGDQNIDRLKMGYIEIIPMAWADVNMDGDGDATPYPTSTSPGHSAYDAVHANGMPAGDADDGKGCERLVNSFSPNHTLDGNGDIIRDRIWDRSTTLSPTNGNPLIASENFWLPIPKGVNPLFGELALINVEGGVAGGTNAVAIADWMEPNVNLLTAQEFPYFLEPTLASANGVWTSSGLYGAPMSNAGTDGVDAALMATTVTNEWANNPNNGSNTDWVVTFPTKSFHADRSFGNIQAGNNRWRTSTGNPDQTTFNASGTVNVADTTNTRPATAPFQNLFDGGSATTLDLNIYDAEERTTTTGGSVSFSPGSLFQTDPTLQYESNVISFVDENSDSPGVNVLGVPDAMKKLTYEARVNLADTSAKTNGHVTVGFKDSNSRDGLPVVGFVFKERNLGDSQKAYGQILDHKYDADVD